jgi:hypothetical protein
MKSFHCFISTLLLLGVSSAPIAAQNFTMPRSAIGGGGGVSAGETFRVAGAIGEPVSGEISDSRFSLQSGFFAPSDSRPGLGIRLGPPSGGVNTVVLFWPNPSTGYLLQQTANMSGPGGGWTNVAVPSVIVGPNKVVTLPATGGVCFFRLRRQ